MGRKIRKKFICVKCGRKFPTENAAWTHISFKHPGSTDLSVEIQCSHCNEQFKNISELDQHVLQHEQGPETITPRPINDERFFCNSILKYYCSLCIRKFSSENALWTHAAFKHVNSCESLSTLYYCDPCKLVFNTLEEFNQHQETSSEPYLVDQPVDLDPVARYSEVQVDRDFQSEILLMSTILSND